MREVREFSESGALSNNPNAVETLEEELRAEIAPPNPSQILDDTAGSDEFSTLSRFLVQTQQPVEDEAGVPQGYGDIDKAEDVRLKQGRRKRLTWKKQGAYQFSFNPLDYLNKDQDSEELMTTIELLLDADDIHYERLSLGRKVLYLFGIAKDGESFDKEGYQAFRTLVRALKKSGVSNWEHKDRQGPSEYAPFPDGELKIFRR